MQTKIIGGGILTPGVEWGVDPAFQAGRVSLRALDHTLAGQVLGHYRVGGSTTAAAPAANSILATFRWADPSRICVMGRISINITVATAVTAQRTDPVFAIVQRAYTASETTSITAITPSANSGKARVNMGSSLVTQIAVASAAAGITGGTKTGDASPVGSVGVNGLGAIGSGVTSMDILSGDPSVLHPVTFGVNEGILLQWGGTALATGTVVIAVTFSWAELVAF